MTPNGWISERTSMMISKICHIKSVLIVNVRIPASNSALLMLIAIWYFLYNYTVAVNSCQFYNYIITLQTYLQPLKWQSDTYQIWAVGVPLQLKLWTCSLFTRCCMLVLVRYWWDIGIPYDAQLSSIYKFSISYNRVNLVQCISAIGVEILLSTTNCTKWNMLVLFIVWIFYT